MHHGNIQLKQIILRVFDKVTPKHNNVIQKQLRVQNILLPCFFSPALKSITSAITQTYTCELYKTRVHIKRPTKSRKVYSLVKSILWKSVSHFWYVLWLCKRLPLGEAGSRVCATSLLCFTTSYVSTIISKGKKLPPHKFYKSEFPDVMLEFHKARNQIDSH